MVKEKGRASFSSQDESEILLFRALSNRPSVLFEPKYCKFVEAFHNVSECKTAVYSG